MPVMIEFVAQMPTNTMIFVGLAIVGLFATLVIVLRVSPWAATQHMSERGDIWLSRGFSVTCTLSAFIGMMVGALLGERWPSASVRQCASAQLA